MNDLSGTVQAFSSLASGIGAFGQLNAAQVGCYLLGILAAYLGSAVVTQHLLEFINAYVKPPFWLKLALPKVWSSIIGWMLTKSGMDWATATAASTSFAALLEKVHGSPLALDLEGEVKGIFEAPFFKNLFASKAAPAAVTAAPQAPAAPSATPTPAPVAPPAGPSAPGAALILALLGVLALAGVAKANTTPTASAYGFVGSPSVGLTGPLLSVQPDESLTPTSEVVEEGQYGIYYGQWTVDADGNLSYNSLVYLNFGVGLSSGAGETRGVVTASLGYTNFGIIVAKNLGDGEPPLFGIQGQWNLTNLVHGLVWDLSNVRSSTFPTATW